MACQEVIPTLEGYVTTIVVGMEMNILLGWLHHPMFYLSQQCLLFASRDVEVREQVLQQESVICCNFHELCCKVTNMFLHVIAKWCETLASLQENQPNVTRFYDYNGA